MVEPGYRFLTSEDVRTEGDECSVDGTKWFRIFGRIGLLYSSGYMPYVYRRKITLDNTIALWFDDYTTTGMP